MKLILDSLLLLSMDASYECHMCNVHTQICNVMSAGVLTVQADTHKLPPMSLSPQPISVYSKQRIGM